MRARILRLLVCAAIAATAALALPATAGAQGGGGICNLLPWLPSCQPEPEPEPEPPTPPQPPQPPEPPPPTYDPRAVDPKAPNPLLGVTNWWLDRHKGALWRQYREFMRRDEPRNAAMMRKLAVYPNFKWFGTWHHRPYHDIRSYLTRVQEQQPGSVPQITIMRRLHKRCDGRYNGGGRSENQAYRRWIKEFAAGIGSRRVVIAYEPDSTGSLECDSRSQQRVRMHNYRYAVDILSKLPNATVYLEAGASDWRPAHVIARRLRRIGIHKVRGFMVNVTHHDWTRNNIRFCKQLSKMLRGKHCVISTTDNGNGPLRFKRWRDRKRNIWYWENIWCNPPNGASGPPPQVAPLGRSHVVDAYLWIGRPGYSGGICNGGPKEGAGVFWPKLALRLARRAKW